MPTIIDFESFPCIIVYDIDHSNFDCVGNPLDDTLNYGIVYLKDFEDLIMMTTKSIEELNIIRKNYLSC